MIEATQIKVHCDGATHARGQNTHAMGRTNGGCKFGAGHGMSLGSNIRGGVRHLIVDPCDFDGTHTAPRKSTPATCAQHLIILMTQYADGHKRAPPDYPGTQGVLEGPAANDFCP